MSDVRVEPEWAMVTVVFVDIRGFTTFADKATARDAFAYLDEFFGVVVPVVDAHAGKVNQLQGDGLLAVFDVPDHADRALAAGQAILAAVDTQFGDRCRIGIGVNSGLVLMGTIGVAPAAGLSLIGDPVNVASRVQDATRDLGEPLQATYLLLDGEHPELEPRGTLSLKGKAQPVAVYGLAPASVTVPGRLARTTEHRCSH
jgi:class 3 adenylate cyclase